MVAYRKRFFIRGFNCKALTGKVLVFWITGSAFGRKSLTRGTCNVAHEISTLI